VKKIFNDIIKFITDMKLINTNIILTTNQLVFITCCYNTLILNLPFLIKASTTITALDNYNVLFLLSIPVFLLALTLILQCFLAFRWITKPVLIFTIIVSSLIFYSTINYGIIFDYGMVQNTIETDKAEAFSYFNIYALSYFMLFGVLPAFFIYNVKLSYKPFLGELVSRIKLISSACLMVLIIASCFYSNYAAVGRNNKNLISYIIPYKMYDATYKFIRNNYFSPPLKFSVLDRKPTIVRTNNQKHVTVLVLGETARAQSFSLNGYEKPTNQFTENLGVVSFTNMSSCGTATAVSVPCMFSRLNKDNYNKRLAIAQQNVVDLVHLAGADVLWLSNNNGSCKGVCTRVKNQQIDVSKLNPLCDGEYCYDEVLLNPLKNKLKNLTHHNTLILLHLIGSHGPTYYKRYPQSNRLFSPDCQRSDIQNCTEEELINTYDNTIAYTDYVLSKIINELNNSSQNNNLEASMLYISDHGESLGEKGVYLHGLPYAFAPEQQTHIPMLFWTDTKQTDFDLSCLNSMKNIEISHDYFFDTLLSIMSVKTKAYQPNNDVFCNANLKER